MKATGLDFNTKIHLWNRSDILSSIQNKRNSAKTTLVNAVEMGIKNPSRTSK